MAHSRVLHQRKLTEKDRLKIATVAVEAGIHAAAERFNYSVESIAKFRAEFYECVNEKIKIWKRKSS